MRRCPDPEARAPQVAVDVLQRPRAGLAQRPPRQNARDNQKRRLHLEQQPLRPDLEEGVQGRHDERGEPPSPNGEAGGSRAVLRGEHLH